MKPIRLSAGSHVRLIVLKFRISDMKNIPLGMEYRSTGNRSAVSSYSAGVMLVDRRDRSSLSEVLKAMEQVYVLVDAFCTPAPEKEFSSGGYMAEFVFCRKTYARPSEQFVARRQKIYNGLWALCKDALWSVRIYSNPHFEDGKQIVDACSVSINCAGRTALIAEDGKPVMVWPRNTAGNPQKLGAKVPLAPEHVLLMVSKTSELAAAN